MGTQGAPQGELEKDIIILLYRLARYKHGTVWALKGAPRGGAGEGYHYIII